MDTIFLAQGNMSALFYGHGNMSRNWNLTQLEQHILLFESVLPFSETGDRFNSCCFFSRWY